ncbi:hypothetical protein [Crocinitomix catalasitica]|uniref:hypothetical protein n=1 Tax=Crocinitomix catalasitica TaxID=184607 RepID=UPI000480B13B|nr:hypothetical protein [Crocinitomix catalasitica]
MITILAFIILSCTTTPENGASQPISSADSFIDSDALLKDKIVSFHTNFKTEFISIDYDSLSQCQDWWERANYRGLRNLIYDGEAIRYDEFSLYEHTECFVSGVLTQAGEEFKFEINSGNWFKLVHEDTIMYFHTENSNLNALELDPIIDESKIQLTAITKSKFNALKSGVNRKDHISSNYFEDIPEKNVVAADGENLIPGHLKVYCSDDTLIFKDYIDMNDDWGNYTFSFTSKIDILNLFVIHYNGYEWSHYLLFDNETCDSAKIIRDIETGELSNKLDGLPYFSNNLNKMLSVCENFEYSEEHGYHTRLDLYEQEGGKYNLKMQTSIVGNLGNISDVIWLNEKELLFFTEKSWNDGDGRGMQEELKYFILTITA